MEYFVMSQDKTFYDYPQHCHELWEVLMNIEGCGTATIDGEKYPFRPGTIFCIRPGVMHSKQAENGFLDGSILVRDFCFESDPDNVLVFQDDDRQSFYSLFKLTHGYPLDPVSDIYAERFLRNILDAMQNLLRHWRDQPCKNSEVLRVRKILADHVSDPDFDINAVIGNTSYSPNHFRKLFKEQCGCSPLRYYSQLKIQMAKQQILHYKTVLSIDEIARRCGFADPFYFSRVFKKITGLSPMQFYKQSLEDIHPVKEI